MTPMRHPPYVLPPRRRRTGLLAGLLGAALGAVTLTGAPGGPGRGGIVPPGPVRRRAARGPPAEEALPGGTPGAPPHT
ncbi:peptidase S12, partial [Kitasatospora sp. NPDC059599]